MSGNGARPRIAVVLVTHNTERNSLRGVWKYRGLMVHTNRGFKAVPDVQPLIGVIVAEMPQAVSREGYMALLTHREEVAMIVLDYKTGRQMIDVCLAVDAETEKGDTIDEGHGVGDLMYEIALHLESATIP